MKKNLFALSLVLFILASYGLPAFSEEKILKTEEKEAQIIDETKMQEKTEQIAKKEVKRLEKEAKKLEQAQRKQKAEELKQIEKEQKLVLKQEEKAEKIKAKEEMKALKEQEKAAKKIKPEKTEEQAADIQKEEVSKNTSAVINEEKEEKTQANANKEKKIKKEDIDKALEENNENKIKEVSSLKESEETQKEETSSVQNEEAPELNKEVNKETKPKKPEEVKEEKEVTEAPNIYRKNLTYEDIDKNAVSINEFLQFTKSQNEKFSIFYYKTTSVLNSYSAKIKAKEKQIEEIKKGNLGIKTGYDKLKKSDRELETLLRERDEFYNKSLEKFNSMLTKKQSLKWELLQQMGYRFFPEFE